MQDRNLYENEKNIYFSLKNDGWLIDKFTSWIKLVLIYSG